MKRRDLLRTMGAVTALSLLPREAEAFWERIDSGYRTADGLTAAQRRLVTSIADMIIPRTDTPGASDVGVTDWVNLVVVEYYNDGERTPFLAGLDAIDANAVRDAGAPFADLVPEWKDRIMKSLDQPADRTLPESKAYSRLKGLVVHGYFTSRRVQMEVLKTEIMPMRFDGAAPLKITRRAQ